MELRELCNFVIRNIQKLNDRYQLILLPAGKAMLKVQYAENLGRLPGCSKHSNYSGASFLLANLCRANRSSIHSRWSSERTLEVTRPVPRSLFPRDSTCCMNMICRLDLSHF
jgi:hypothetical protein